MYLEFFIEKVNFNLPIKRNFCYIFSSLFVVIVLYIVIDLIYIKKKLFFPNKEILFCFIE